jgi:hypothetical protein
MPKSITLSNFYGSQQQCSTSTIDQSADCSNSRKRHFSTSALMQDESNAPIAAHQLPCLVPINTFASSANFGAGNNK